MRQDVLDVGEDVNDTGVVREPLDVVDRIEDCLVRVTNS